MLERLDPKANWKTPPHLSEYTEMDDRELADNLINVRVASKTDFLVGLLLPLVTIILLLPALIFGIGAHQQGAARTDFTISHTTLSLDEVNSAMQASGLVDPSTTGGDGGFESTTPPLMSDQAESIKAAIIQADSKAEVYYTTVDKAPAAPGWATLMLFLALPTTLVAIFLCPIMLMRLIRANAPVSSVLVTGVFVVMVVALVAALTLNPFTA